MQRQKWSISGVSVQFLASLKPQFEHGKAYKDLLSVRVDILKEVKAKGKELSYCEVLPSQLLQI